MCAGERASDNEDPPCVATCPSEALMLITVDVKRKKEMEVSMKVLVDDSMAYFDTAPS